MDCRGHLGVEAVDRCAGCAEPFCGNCLVEIHGKKYCAACKVLAVPAVPVLEGFARRCRGALGAMICAIIGGTLALMTCPPTALGGIVLEIVALVQASNAKKMIEQDPQLTGWGMVLSAQILGWLFLAIASLMLIYTFTLMGRRF